MDLWVKIEDFQDAEGNFEQRFDYKYGHRLFLRFLEYVIISAGSEEPQNLLDLKLKEGMYRVQKQVEDRIFSRLPAISEQYRLGGQELNYYITPNAPVGKPMLIINPEDWAKKWNPSIYTSPIAWMFMEMKRKEMLDRKEELDQEHAKDPQDRTT